MPHVVQSHHEQELTIALESIYETGVVHIYKTQLARWYGGFHLEPAIYRDINRRWEELAAELGHPDVPLFVGGSDEWNILTFIWGQNLAVADPAEIRHGNFWFLPISHWVEEENFHAEE